MKKHYLLWVFLLTSYTLFGQTNSLTGKVIDQKSKQVIEYASIAVYNATDSSLINGTVTNQKGVFTLTKLPNTSIYYKVQFIGYKTFTSSAFVPTGTYNAGEIGLSLNATKLDEVVVQGRAVTSIHKLDKQVFDAGQFQNARGGNAADVLRNLPSVSINSLGEISVRGATGFLVMINGKPVQGDPNVILQQLPANAIDDVEIVTAPSAKYDPDGNAGIINFKTKQALFDGNYLVVNVLGGLPSIEPYDNANAAPRFGADITFNTKKGKWDFSAGLDYRRYDISGRREGYVNTYLNEVLTEFPSDGERSFDELNYSGRASIAYSPNRYQTFTLGFYAGKRTKERTADILYTNQRRTSIPQSQFLGTTAYYDLYKQNNEVFGGGTALNNRNILNENLRVRRSDFIIGSFDYAYRFKDQSTLKFSYECTILGGPTDNVNLDPNTRQVYQLQYNDNDNPLDGIRIQLDYARKLGKTQWESGYLFRYLQHPGDFQYFDRDLANNTWIENPLFTNKIDLQRSIHSVYSQLSGKAGKLSYNAGVRVEYFDRTVKIARPDNTFKLDQFNLFPSVNLGYALSESTTLKAGYSRRIERITTFKMTPFPEREHSETLEQGDAELQPEYIDLAELGFVKNWGDHSIFATAYYRRVNNVINRVNTVFNDTILNRIYTNVGVANAFGLEIGTTLYPTKNWRVYLGGNVYNYGIEGTLFNDPINTSNVIYSINANTNINFTPTLTMQLAFNYLSERVTAQGRDSEFYNPSLTIRKSFMNKRLAVSLQWLNIDLGLWNANEQRITTSRDAFFTTTNYVYEVDIVQLSLTYQINRSSKKVRLPDSEFGKKEF